MKAPVRMNLSVRLRNPWFWVGLGGMFLTAIDVSPQTLTSWDAVGRALGRFVENPFLIGTTAMAMLGQLMDPTPPGPRDGERALTHAAPGKPAGADGAKGG